MNPENSQLRCIIEGAILAADEPLSVAKLQSLFDEEDMPEKEVLFDVLSEIKKSCEQRGFDLIEVASGWRFQVRENLATWVNRLWEEKPQKYSRALLETLSLIAYRQPITRGDIEEVRGVAVSSHIIKTLTERGWVKVVGHRDVPGRPALYATTKSFLDYFNLKSLDELPTLGELKDIDSLNQNLVFDEAAQMPQTSDDGPKVDDVDASDLFHEAEDTKAEDLPDATGFSPDAHNDTSSTSSLRVFVEEKARLAEVNPNSENHLVGGGSQEISNDEPSHD